MQHHPIASLPRTAALVACIAALCLALAGSAAAAPQQLSEHSGEQAAAPQPQQFSEHSGDQSTAASTTTNPQVGDTPSDRVSPTAAAPVESSTTASNDGDDNAPLIIGASILTVALLGSGMYVARRRRHLAPGH